MNPPAKTPEQFMAQLREHAHSVGQSVMMDPDKTRQAWALETERIENEAADLAQKGTI